MLYFVCLGAILEGLLSFIEKKTFGFVSRLSLFNTVLWQTTIEKEDGSLMLHNLRFGLLGNPPNSNLTINERYIFKFSITEKDGKIIVAEERGMDKINVSEMFSYLWNRVKGE